MLYHMIIPSESKLAQIAQNENVRAILKDFDNYLKNKGVLCAFSDELSIILVKGENSENRKILECKIPSYCFEEKDDTIKLALTVTFIIKKIRGNF